MEIARALITSYLIATLAATALAKLKNWRFSSFGVTRESVIPSRAAAPVVIVVAAAELILATLFTLGTAPRVAGLAGACLFLAFCGYQLLVAARTNSLMCSCAGTARTDPASLPALADMVLACLVQAGLSCTLALIAARPGGIFYVFTAAAWLIPVTVFCIGFAREAEGSEMKTRFWLT